MADNLTFGSEFAESIRELLAELGREIELCHTSRVYDSGSGKTVEKNSTSKIFGVVVPKKQAYINNESSNDIEHTVLRAYLSSSVAPEEGDILIVGTAKYRIESVDTYDPQGVALLYDCKVSK